MINKFEAVAEACRLEGIVEMLKAKRKELLKNRWILYHIFRYKKIRREILHLNRLIIVNSKEVKRLRKEIQKVHDRYETYLIYGIN